MTNMEPGKGEIVMFNATKQNVSLHINNIDGEGELDKLQLSRIT